MRQINNTNSRYKVQLICASFWQPYRGSAGWRRAGDQERVSDWFWRIIFVFKQKSVKNGRVALSLSRYIYYMCFFPHKSVPWPDFEWNFAIFFGNFPEISQKLLNQWTDRGKHRFCATKASCGVLGESERERKWVRMEEEVRVGFVIILLWSPPNDVNIYRAMPTSDLNRTICGALEDHLAFITGQSSPGVKQPSSSSTSSSIWSSSSSSTSSSTPSPTSSSTSSLSTWVKVHHNPDQPSPSRTPPPLQAKPPKKQRCLNLSYQHSAVWQVGSNCPDQILFILVLSCSIVQLQNPVQIRLCHMLDFANLELFVSGKDHLVMLTR